jgi:nicotinate-nucleotide pyrophosphorylase (carboxylating)
MRDDWLDRALVAAALKEDVGRSDVTTLACVPAGQQARAVIINRAAGVIAGLPIVVEVMHQADPAIRVTLEAAEGTFVPARTILAQIAGPAQGILIGERVALNFLGRLSGIATATRACMQEAGGKAQIIDTRKTTPGLRALEKYAVRMGGGRNHRFGLDDGVLIKDNHIIAGGGISQAVARARAAVPHLLKIEVECDTLDEVRQALAAGADAILLDNMTTEQMAEAVGFIRSQQPGTIVEASGNIGTDPQRIAAVAATGVDFISIGALTHSAGVLDVGLDFLVDA